MFVSNKRHSLLQILSANCLAKERSVWSPKQGGWASEPGTPCSSVSETGRPNSWHISAGEPRTSDARISDEHTRVGIGNLWLLGQMWLGWVENIWCLPAFLQACDHALTTQWKRFSWYSFMISYVWREEKTGHFHHAGVEDLGSTPQQGGPCLEEKINSEEWSPGVIQAKTWFYQGSD